MDISQNKRLSLHKEPLDTLFSNEAYRFKLISFDHDLFLKYRTLSTLSASIQQKIKQPLIDECNTAISSLRSLTENYSTKQVSEKMGENRALWLKLPQIDFNELAPVTKCDDKTRAINRCADALNVLIKNKWVFPDKALLNTYQSLTGFQEFNRNPQLFVIKELWKKLHVQMQIAHCKEHKRIGEDTYLFVFHTNAREISKELPLYEKEPSSEDPIYEQTLQCVGDRAQITTDHIFPTCTEFNLLNAGELNLNLFMRPAIESLVVKDVRSIELVISKNVERIQIRSEKNNATIENLIIPQASETFDLENLDIEGTKEHPIHIKKVDEPQSIQFESEDLFLRLNHVVISRTSLAALQRIFSTGTIERDNITLINVI